METWSSGNFVVCQFYSPTRTKFTRYKKDEPFEYILRNLILEMISTNVASFYDFIRLWEITEVI